MLRHRIWSDIYCTFAIDAQQSVNKKFCETTTPQMFRCPLR